MNQFTNNLNVLIVDDEIRACSNLKNMLTEYVGNGLNITGVAYNTYEAEKQISKLSPDAVFLDINMPNENAFHFLERISPFNFEVIFVTSYDEYAIKAFRFNAVDYILKPLSINDLRNAVQKLNDKISYKKITANNKQLYSRLSKEINEKTIPQKIVLKGINTVEIVELKNIYFIEAMGSYSKISFLKDNSLKEITMSNPLTEYEEILTDRYFFRIHRSYLVNVLTIRKIVNEESHKIILHSGTMLPVSRRKLPLLLDFIKSNDFKNN